ncbi:MAG: methyltransferase domain-containing protein, partial [Rhodothermales bacterium]|nr:methyltransferase domain-containing protein [Rhodothermales bacterium]
MIPLGTRFPREILSMRDSYTIGYQDNLIGWFSERSVEREGSFFVPYLKEGMKVLDVGCGPGALTLGIAERVGPSGSVLGIDIEGEQFDRGLAAAAERGLDNVAFRVGSAYEIESE